jgi:hypothetical protein
LTPQIATRAYELYEQSGRRGCQSVQNWDKAEQEIRASQTKATPKALAKAGSAPEAKAQPTADTNSKPAAEVEPASAVKEELKPETKPYVKPESTLDPKPKIKTEPAADLKVSAKPDTNLKSAAEVSPQLVQRVHKFYEQLGREDVCAVEKSDQAKQRTPEAETKK